MRLVVVVATGLLLVACSQPTTGQPRAADPAPSGGRPTPTTTTAAAPIAPPAPGASIAQVQAWIEAGEPDQPARFHTATREGRVTDLGEDVAFVTPGGMANCMTDRRAGGALACLVTLADPPAPPDDVYGEWKGNWIDFDGPTLLIGSVHGDPGRFDAGTGPDLPYGRSLAFGDYRCRSDLAGLYCINYAHRSAVRFSTDGVEPFGCLQPADPPAGVGRKYWCRPA